MVLDVPNAFIKKNMPPKKDGYKRVIMKITGVIVDMLLELYSETYIPSEWNGYLKYHKVLTFISVATILVNECLESCINYNFIYSINLMIFLWACKEHCTAKTSSSWKTS